MIITISHPLRVASTWEMSTFLQYSRYHACRSVFRMEKDRLIPGNILFSQLLGNLCTTDGNKTAAVYSLTHTYPADFTQISEFEIVLAANHERCLFILNRTNDQVSPFAGACDGKEGLCDGTEPLFTSPYLITHDNSNPDLLYFVDGFAVRMLNMSQTLFVTTLFVRNNSSRYTEITDMTVDLDGTYLYLCYVYWDYRHTGLVRYHRATNESEEILRREYLFFCMNLYRNFMVVTQGYDESLLFIDLDTKSNFSICTGETGHRNGNSSFCQLLEPESFVVIGDEIFVEDQSGISVLKGRVEGQLIFS